MSEIDKHMEAIRAGVGDASKGTDKTVDHATEALKEARERAGEALYRVAQGASAAIKDVREAASETLKNVQDDAGPAIGAASERAGKVLNDAREAFDDARAQASETLKGARENVADATERLRHNASDKYDRAQDWAHERYDSLSRNATYARRRGIGEFNRGRRGIAAFVEENPIMVGVAGLAAGLLIGALLPRTRRENELMGPYADDLRREGTRYAKDVAQEGRDSLSENLRAMTGSQDRDPRER